DNRTGNAMRFDGEYIVQLNDGSNVTYRAYRCSKPIVIEAPEGLAEVNTQGCTGERATPLTVPDALSLAQNATLVRARLIFEGDITTPWYSADGSLAPT